LFMVMGLRPMILFLSRIAPCKSLCLKADVTDRFYNVGRGVQTSIKELTEIILKITGSHFSIQYQPGGTTFVTNRVGRTKKAEAEIGFRAYSGSERRSARLSNGEEAIKKKLLFGVASLEFRMAKHHDIMISHPDTGEEEWKALREPLMKGWLTQGSQVGAFERLLLKGTAFDLESPLQLYDSASFDF